jgi:hypothetical protein
MGRRTKDEIEQDEQFTCSKKGCKGVHEDIFKFTSYHKKAVEQDLYELPFCEEHFKEIENQLEKL